MHRCRILVEGARFPPFGFDTTDISSNSIENISLQRKHVFNNPTQPQPNPTPTQPSPTQPQPNLYNDVFSIELELLSVVSNPKGGNRAPSTRIRRRCIFNPSSASIYRCGHLLIDAAASINRCGHLFIDAAASINKCGYL